MAGIKEALVTGASGFVGYHVSRLLVERGWRVRVFVRSTSPLFHLRELPNQVFHGDIQDVVALRAAMRGVGTVFHVTGHVSFQRRERAEIERVNVGGTSHSTTAPGSTREHKPAHGRCDTRPWLQ